MTVIRNPQAGAGRVKTIITLAIIAAIIYLAFKTVPVYVNNYELEDAMKTEARFAAVNRKSPEEVRDAVLRKIQELKIPARRDDIRVEPLGNSGIRITVIYSVPINFLGYQFTLDFAPTADNMSV